MERLSDKYLQVLVDYPDQFNLEKSYMARELLALRKVAEAAKANLCLPYPDYANERALEEALAAWEEME